MPSTYSCAGLPKIKKPVIAAENTKSKSRVIGTSMVFALPTFIRLPKYMKNPTAIIYKAVATELIKAVFLISFITLWYQIIKVFRSAAYKNAPSTINQPDRLFSMSQSSNKPPGLFELFKTKTYSCEKVVK